MKCGCSHEMFKTLPSLSDIVGDSREDDCIVPENSDSKCGHVCLSASPRVEGWSKAVEGLAKSRQYIHFGVTSQFRALKS